MSSSMCIILNSRLAFQGSSVGAATSIGEPGRATAEEFWLPIKLSILGAGRAHEAEDPSGGVMAEQIFEIVLAIMSGPDDGRKVRLRREDGDGTAGTDGAWVLVLGRRDDCDLSLPFDTQTSREHARLVYTRDGSWVLEDMGSRNGTYIGRKRLDHPAELPAGTLFRIGRTWLRLEEMG